MRTDGFQPSPMGAPRRRSALGLMRGGGRVLAMIGVGFAVASSIAYVIPNANAVEPIVAEAQVEQAGAQVLPPVAGSVAAAVVVRDSYTVTSKPPPPPPPPPPVAQKPVASASSSHWLAPSASTAALQWPLPSGIPMSSGFGPRSCSGCSSMHQGVDFNPPSGTPIWAMAAGTVVQVQGGAGYTSYGVYVKLQHVINGEMVTSLYAHMLSGSMPLSVGDTVSAGQVIGAVGCTGSCTGTHLHFEIHPGGGAAVDPITWFNARVG